jgi:hypothetical protein
MTTFSEAAIAAATAADHAAQQDRLRKAIARRETCYRAIRDRCIDLGLDYPTAPDDLIGGNPTDPYSYYYWRVLIEQDVTVQISGITHEGKTRACIEAPGFTHHMGYPLTGGGGRYVEFETMAEAGHLLQRVTR